MIVNIFNPFLILISIFLFSFTQISAKQSNNSLINSSWGELFALKSTESGDTVSVGAVFSDGADIFIYDMADGRIVTFDSSGSVLHIIKLQSVGRGTYAGDDFIVKGNEFVFLNSVDRRLEYFNIINGSHTRSIQIAESILALEPTRARRIIDRIFLQNGTVLVGNEHVAVPIDPVLGKKLSTSKTLSADSPKRLLFAGLGKVITGENKKLLGFPCTECINLVTHYPVYGKRLAVVGGNLFSLVLTDKGVLLTKVK